MQKSIVGIAMVVLLLACRGGGGYSFTVSGTLKNAPSKVVYIEEVNASNGQVMVRDSATIGEDGKYSFSVESNHEAIYNLRLQNDVPHFASIINDESSIKLNADFSKKFDFYEVSGSDASETIQKYLARLNEMQREMFNYRMQSDSVQKSGGNAELINDLNAKQKELAKRIREFTQKTVEQADNSSLALHILSTYFSMARDPNYMMNNFNDEELLVILNGMVTKFPERTDIAGIRNTIESRIPKAIWVGKQAPEISMPDTEGKTVSLSSFRGQYVLVDFWASWCGPCRMENPNVVDAYNKYRDKNFTILGVSLDRPGQKERWLQAIKDDKLTWTHISDLKFWQSEVVPVYNIQSIPFNVLVDPGGKVIAENLRGSALEQKLEQVLN